MSNKQSSVEWLAVRLKEKMQMWNSTKNYQEFHIVLEAGEFAKLIEQAKAMHKQEIIAAKDDNYVYGEAWEKLGTLGEQYYNETFGGNNEQQ